MITFFITCSIIAVIFRKQYLDLSYPLSNKRLFLQIILTILLYFNDESALLSSLSKFMNSATKVLFFAGMLNIFFLFYLIIREHFRMLLYSTCNFPFMLRCHTSQWSISIFSQQFPNSKSSSRDTISITKVINHENYLFSERWRRHDVSSFSILLRFGMREALEFLSQRGIYIGN